MSLRIEIAIHDRFRSHYEVNIADRKLSKKIQKHSEETQKK